MSDVNCQINIPNVDGLPEKELTVGRHFVINCLGQWDKSFKFDQAQLMLNSQEQHVLKLFKAEARDTQSFDLDVTTYVAGQITIPQLQISDGSHQISLGDIQFEVRSVLPQPETQSQQSVPQEQPKPFGYAFGHLNWPLIYTLSIIGFLFAFVLYVLFKAIRRQKWKRLSEQVRSFDSVQSPEQQFYKSIRQIEKRRFPTDELVKACRIYILRQYQLPVFDLAISESNQFLKNKFVRFGDHRKVIINMLKDIEHISNSSNLNDEQKQKFIKNFYNFIDKCESLPQDSVIRNLGREN